MQILPLKFIHEEDKKTVGANLYHLAKLSHLGIPVIESVVAIPPVSSFEKVLNKYLKHNFIIKDNLNNIKTELLNLPVPESLQGAEFIKLASGKAKAVLDTKKLWDNLLEKWVYEMLSKIERQDKNLFQLTPQLVVFTANFTAFGQGFFDEDREHAVIKIDKGELSFQTSSEIESLILLSNKKLLLSQIYYWGIEDGKIKIVKVSPFTQSLHESIKEGERIISPEKIDKPQIKTATKIFLDYRGEVLANFKSDGVILNINKNDNDLINTQVSKILNFTTQTNFIFFPELELNLDQSLEFAKTFLFFRNKKKLDVQIVMPQTFSIDEFLNLKRDFAALGIYSKGTLKLWKQFLTVSDFLNLDNYLDAGFDGAVIDLDKISELVCGVDGETVRKEGRKDWLDALVDFFKKVEFSKIIKHEKSVLLKGKLCQNEELLNYFIKSGVWAIAFDNSTSGNFREHISFLEKQAIKKLPRIEV